MIDSVSKLFSAFQNATGEDFKSQDVRSNEVYAAFFFGMTITMCNTYELNFEASLQEILEIFQTEFGFDAAHAGEFITFLMQSMAPRVNPEFFAVIRLGMDDFYDLEDGNTDDLTTVLPTLVDSILGGTRSDVQF